MGAKECLLETAERELESKLLEIIKEKLYEKKVEVVRNESIDFMREEVRYKITYYPTLPTISKIIQIPKDLLKDGICPMAIDGACSENMKIIADGCKEDRWVSCPVYFKGGG